MPSAELAGGFELDSSSLSDDAHAAGLVHKMVAEEDVLLKAPEGEPTTGDGLWSRSSEAMICLTKAA